MTAKLGRPRRVTPQIVAEARLLQQAISRKLGIPKSTVARFVGKRPPADYRKYGISEEHYNAMLIQQGGYCAVCREREAIAVDHDHTTGLVRGLLCMACNSGLGHFRDSPQLLLRALEYLFASVTGPMLPPGRMSGYEDVGQHGD